MPVAGGTMALTIPNYRLPAGVLKKAIDFISSHGITIKTKTAIGKDITISAADEAGLQRRLHRHRRPGRPEAPDPGSDLKGVMTALDFLSKVKKGRKTDLGEQVLVIGGGSVAFDCARTARRLGVKRGPHGLPGILDTMPADADEIREGRGRRRRDSPLPNDHRDQGRQAAG